MDHYDWLEKHLGKFFENLGIYADYAIGMGSAHGDKCYSYRNQWEKVGIRFEHGVAIYLLSYVYPFSNEVRKTPNGWIAPVEWVIANHERFLPAIKKAETE